MLIEEDQLLVGLRTWRRDSHPNCGAEDVPFTLVVSFDGRRPDAVARLKRWKASQAAVLLWRDAARGLVELCQLHTGQWLHLHAVPQPAAA